MGYEKRADEFKKKCQKYITFYNFLIQIYPFKNLNLLRLQVYLVALLRKLPKKGKERIDIDHMLSLDYYKLQKLGNDDKKGEDISLYHGEGELVGISETATSRVAEEDEEYLDDIIKKINDVFGVGLTEEDRIIIDQYEEMFKTIERVTGNYKKENENNNSAEMSRNVTINQHTSKNTQEIDDDLFSLEAQFQNNNKLQKDK